MEVLKPSESAEKKNVLSVSKEIKIPEDMPKVYAIGAAGGFTPYDFRILFFDAGRHQPEGRVEIALSPLAAKELRDWLDGLVKEFEKKVRKIERKPGMPNKSEMKQSGQTLRMFG
ncbi:MAG: DUF3467 domain-containing protein [archaeon]